MSSNIIPGSPEEGYPQAHAYLGIPGIEELSCRVISILGDIDGWVTIEALGFALNGPVYFQPFESENDFRQANIHYLVFEHAMDLLVSMGLVEIINCPSLNPDEISANTGQFNFSDKLNTLLCS